MNLSLCRARHTGLAHRDVRVVKRLAPTIFGTLSMRIMIATTMIMHLMVSMITPILAILVVASPMLGTAQAREPNEPVELAVWQRGFSGRIGEKTIEVSALSRIGAQLKGQYCYGRCNATRDAITLRGRWENGVVVLEESVSDGKGKRKVTGHWHLQAQQSPWRGEWHSADGKRRLPIHLIENEPIASADEFVDEIRVLAEHVPGGEDDSCEAQSPAVSEIRLYREGRLRQTLQTDSMGTCNMFLPDMFDMNFDGKLDLTIALTLPAGPNIPHQSWLYDAKRDRFVDAPESLQDITSPMFDAERKRVYNYWRGSCCSHGVDVYRWNQGELERIDGAESHFMPVKRGGKLGYVYSTPSYENGHIVFAPRIERDAQGALQMTPLGDSDIDFETTPPFSEALKVNVYAADSRGGFVLKTTQAMRWRKISGDKTKATRWCPDLPYFDIDRRRLDRQLIDHAEACTDTDPR
jgi:hypothetical protein